MHNEVAVTIRQTPVDDGIAMHEYVLKSVCLKHPDLASALNNGRQAVSTYSKAIKAYSKKCMASQILDGE